MAVKGGQIIHAGNGATVIDRVQTGGPGQVNIPTEKIYELGNYKSVATVRDTPDLQFSLESFDVSTEVEALLAGQYAGRSVADGAMTAADNTLTSATIAFVAADVGRQVIVAGAGDDDGELVTTIATVTNGTTVELTDPSVGAVTAANVLVTTNGFDLSLAVPVDFASQFKAGVNETNAFDVISSVALPFLYLEQMSYRFGLRDNATQNAQLRGDTIFYNPGPTFVESAAGSNTPGQTVVTAHPAYAAAQSDERRVLAVTVGTQRLTFGADYTESYGTVTDGAAVTTVTLTEAVPTTKNIRIIYSSPSTVTYNQAVHPTVAVKPAAVKGRDIEIYIGGYDPNDVAGSQVNKITSVQSVNVDWRVTLDKDEEFGNYYAVGIDFDVPQVNGTVEFKPRSPAELQALVRQFSNVTDQYAVVGTATSSPLELDIVIKHADDDNRVIKRIHVPDARFTPPAIQGRVQQKLTVSVPFESDEGSMLVYSR